MLPEEPQVVKGWLFSDIPDCFVTDKPPKLFKMDLPDNTEGRQQHLSKGCWEEEAFWQIEIILLAWSKKNVRN